ncbi:hypothetical protein KKG41_06270, partial [Patescibacteria group bacterium]|nr:hypothetical protein [Patescibacteria group bacterium]MBU1891057.1 hypothetical protein [Patescibacteria group bacterium]
MAQTDSQKARDLRQEKKQGKDRGQGDSAQDTKKQTGNTKQSQDDISNRTGRSPSAKMNQEKQMGRDYRSQSNLAQTMGGNN